VPADCDPQRDGELAGASRCLAIRVGAIEASPLATFADAETDRFRRTAHLVCERLPPQADLGLDVGQAIHDGE
jgi:hypothetical protein